MVCYRSDQSVSNQEIFFLSIEKNPKSDINNERSFFNCAYCKAVAAVLDKLKQEEEAIGNAFIVLLLG